jgi:low affinity Fe/Cu permease
MRNDARSSFADSFHNFAAKASYIAGTKWAFILAVVIILAWAVTGPYYHYSDTWQLVINTGTTIVTFLMVFLIQQAQNKDTHAIELKLNELVAAMEGASNRLIDVESLSDEDLETLRRFYQQLATMAKRDRRLTESHSIDEAQALHQTKITKSKHG